jgi:PAS domain S-box-containing protein
MSTDPFDPLGQRPDPCLHGWTPLLDALPQGVMLVDAAGRNLEVNSAAVEILGRERAALRSSSLAEIWSDLSSADGSGMAPEDFPGLVALKAGIPVRERTVGLNRADGSTLWLTVSAEPLPAGGALVSFADITAMFLAHRNLRTSEERHRFLADNAIDVIWTMDLQGRFTYMSPSVERLRGYTPAEVMAKPLFEMLPAAYVAEARETLQAGVARITSGQSFPDFRGEFELQRKDGTLVWTEVTVTSMLDKAGRFIEFLGVTRNIDDRKRMETLLRENEERYRAQFSLAGEGILTQTLEGDLIEVNEAYARMHGYRPHEMANMRLRDLLPPESFKMSKERLERILAGEVLSFEVEHFHKDGHLFPLEVSASLITSGGKSTILAFNRDITERKIAEDLLREEHQFSRQIIQSAQEGIIVYGPDLRYLVWNPFMERLSGTPASEVLGKLPGEVFPMLRASGVLERLDQALAGEAIGACRTTWRHQICESNPRQY